MGIFTLRRNLHGGIGSCRAVRLWRGAGSFGGGPYLATTSGGAMMADLPCLSVVIVVGTLSLSTQMY